MSMLNLIAKLGLAVYLASLFKLNARHLRNILIAVLIVWAADYFYADLANFFEAINANKVPGNVQGALFYALLFKYLIMVSAMIWGFAHLMRLSLTEKSVQKKLGSKEVPEHEFAEVKEILRNREMAEAAVAEKADTFKQFEDMQKYPKLKTRADRLYER